MRKGPAPTRLTAVTVSFVYVADEYHDGIYPKLSPFVHGGNEFIVARLKAIGIDTGAVAPGAKWNVRSKAMPKVNGGK